ncbi:MAG: YitT family protein [Amaricoccus sp.]|uniref:YitT family protein n=1 Tax=Amaricoccus sp. TaxID=1872485 RepID=UPI0033164059
MLNLPFYWLVWARMGPRFTLKSLLAVGMLSLFTMLAPRPLTFDHVEPLTGAILAGATSGLGMLAIYRHRASLGGVGVLAIESGVRSGGTGSSAIES